MGEGGTEGEGGVAGVALIDGVATRLSGKDGRRRGLETMMDAE